MVLELVRGVGGCGGMAGVLGKETLRRGRWLEREGRFGVGWGFMGAARLSASGVMNYGFIGCGLRSMAYEEGWDGSGLVWHGMARHCMALSRVVRDAPYWLGQCALLGSRRSSYNVKQGFGLVVNELIYESITHHIIPPE